jgi:hypothetical protein
MDEEIGVRMDSLIRHLRYAREDAGSKSWGMAAGATGLIENHFTSKCGGILQLSAGWDSEGLGVESNTGQGWVIQLRGVAGTSRVDTFAGFGWEDRRRDADVTVISGGSLLEQVRRVGFPTESTQRQPAMDLIPNKIRST